MDKKMSFYCVLSLSGLCPIKKNAFGQKSFCLFLGKIIHYKNYSEQYFRGYNILFV